MKLGEYSGNILGEQDTAIAFHLDVLTSPDRAAIVEENLHFISNRTIMLRRVNNSGDISWHKGRVFISEKPPCWINTLTSGSSSEKR